MPVAAPPSVAELDAIRRLIELPDKPADVEIRPVQLLTLFETWRARGLLGAIGVGHGKTLIFLLLAAVLEAERPVYLCPPGLVTVVLDEAQKWGRYFRVRGDIKIVPYSLLSRPERADILEQLRPDLLMADEAHYLRHRTSARTKRVLRYLGDHDECVFAAGSGTLTSRGLEDLAHLAEGALADGSPLPRRGRDLAAWAAVLDADGDPLPQDWRTIAPLIHDFAPADNEDTGRKRARKAFQQRLRRTAGVVLTEDASCSASLVIRRVRQPEPPPEVLKLITGVHVDGATPDGERIYATDEEASATVRQLALGFWYTWDWRGVPDADRRTWLDARSSYFAGLRTVLAWDLPGLDSRALIESMAAGWRSESQQAFIPQWFRDRRTRWHEVKPLADPKTVTCWASKFLVEDAAAWLNRQTEPAILWYRDKAFGAALRELGVDVRGEGDPPPTVPGPVALSIGVFQEGHNFQEDWRLNRVAGCPSSGKVWEQNLGRTHRLGQPADVVVCDVYQHHEGERRALARALADAKYVEESTGNRQKLRLARIVDERGGINDL